MGMTAYHNFVADPELGEKVAARQIPVCVISDNGVDDGLEIKEHLEEHTVNKNSFDEQ